LKGDEGVVKEKKYRNSLDAESTWNGRMVEGKNEHGQEKCRAALCFLVFLREVDPCLFSPKENVMQRC
jgi:hypothetical protein